MENSSEAETLEVSGDDSAPPAASKSSGFLEHFSTRLSLASSDRNPWSLLSVSLALISVCAGLAAGSMPGHPSWMVYTACATWGVATALGAWGWSRRSLYVHSSLACLVALFLALVSAAAVGVLGARTFNSFAEAVGLLASTLTVVALAWSSASELRRSLRLVLTGAALALCVPAGANAALAASGCASGETLGSCRNTYVPWTSVATPVLYEGQEVPSLLIESAPDDWFSSEMFDITVKTKRGLNDGSLHFEGDVLMTSEGRVSWTIPSPLVYVSFAAPLQWLCVTDGTWVYDSYTAKVLPVSEDSAEFTARDCDELYPDLPTWQDYPPPQVSQLRPMIPVVVFLRSALEKGTLTGDIGGAVYSQSDVMDTRGYSGWYDQEGNFCVTDGATVYSTETKKFVAGSSC